jgi:replicative DNA helicase
MDAQHELEQSVIGAVLLRADTLALLPTLETGDFHDLRGRATWDAIRKLEYAGQPIDVTTIGDELGRDGKLDSVGWTYLSGCAVHVPTVDNAIEYAKRLRDASLRRRLLESLSEVLQAAKDGQLTGAELLSMAAEKLSVLDAEQPEDALSIGDVLRRRMKQLEQIAQDRATGVRSLSGFPTGIARLDEKTGGWQSGIVSIVAARPGTGKSSCLLATADECSKAGFGVHLFSLEDTDSSYADRAMSRDSGVPAEVIRNAELNREQMLKLHSTLNALTRRQGWLFDGRSGITADEIVRSVRRHRKTNGTRVVIVDYVQLVKRPPRASAHEALSEIVTTFADAAKQDNLAYVVLSQLNRELEKRVDKRPQLSDLRESGSLEERAKCVVGLYRGALYDDKPKSGVDYAPDSPPPSLEEFERQVQLLVLKNSNGRTGVIYASWFGPTTRME